MRGEGSSASGHRVTVCPHSEDATALSRALQLHSTFLLTCTPGVAVIPQVLGSLPLPWETRMELLAPGSCLADVGI